MEKNRGERPLRGSLRTLSGAASSRRTTAISSRIPAMQPCQTQQGIFRKPLNATGFPACERPGKQARNAGWKACATHSAKINASFRKTLAGFCSHSCLSAGTDLSFSEESKSLRQKAKRKPRPRLARRAGSSPQGLKDRSSGVNHARIGINLRTTWRVVPGAAAERPAAVGGMVRLLLADPASPAPDSRFPGVPGGSESRRCSCPSGGRLVLCP